VPSGQSKVGGLRSDRFKRFMQGLQIRNERGWIVPMRFSESQEILWSHVSPKLDLDQRLWFIVLKSRQTYASTFFEALTFTRTLEQPGTQSLVLAQDLDSSHALFNMAKLFYDYLPLPKLVPPRVKVLEFPFKTGTSRFRVISAGVSAKGRGTTQTCIHASEVAFWKQPEILTGLFQVMPDLNDTMWILESTANGKVGDGQLFYEEWQRAISGESDLIPIFIPWFIMSKYRRSPGLPEAEWDEEEKLIAKTHGLTPEQLAWRRFAIKTKCQGSLEVFHQEYPASPEEAFISRGLPAFDPLALIRQRTNIRPPQWRGRMYKCPQDDTWKFTDDLKGEVRVWAKPKEGRRYVIGADTAAGVIGGNAACAEVIDIETLEQVACVYGTIAPWDFAIALNAVGLWYNKAVVAVEVNNTGHAVQDPLIRVHNYPNLHMWRGRPDKIRLYRSRLYGWETNVFSRPLLIEAGRRALNENLCTIHEQKLLDELADFTRTDSGKYEAEHGRDDRVIAFLVALRSREENYFEPRKAIAVVSDDELPEGIKIVEQLDPSARAKKRVGDVLREQAGTATKNWLEL